MEPSTDHIHHLLHNEHSGNGLMTKIWGPPGWVTLHAWSFGYPMEPTPEQQNNYRRFYELVGETLPCRYCRESYKEFIQSGDTVLDDAVMKNRESLTRWLYRLHNRVNQKLGVDYQITYEDVVRRYESYRAKCNSKESKKAKGCLAAAHEKMDPFRMVERKNCPILTKSLVKNFVPEAIQRGLKGAAYRFLNLDCEKIDKMDDLMIERDEYCQQIISQMRKEKTPSVETEGPWQGHPTLPELRLLMARCSMLSQKDLWELVNKLKSSVPRYRFTSSSGSS